MGLSEEYRWHSDSEPEEPEQDAVSGKKHDDGKLLFGLINPHFLHDLAFILTQGAQEYGETNWKNVDPKRYEHAVYRHWNEYLCGNRTDKSSGKSHLIHIAANCMFLYAHPKQSR